MDCLSILLIPDVTSKIIDLTSEIMEFTCESDGMKTRSLANTITR